MSASENLNDSECLAGAATLPKNVIVLLQEIQEKHGFLPQEELVSLAKRLAIPSIDIFGVATFYSQFKLSKNGRHVCAVCTGTACHIKNSTQLIASAQKSLGIKKGQTTEDGRVTLDSVNCIGACAKAPAVMIDGEVVGDLTGDALVRILEGLE